MTDLWAFAYPPRRMPTVASSPTMALMKRPRNGDVVELGVFAWFCFICENRALSSMGNAWPMAIECPECGYGILRRLSSDEMAEAGIQVSA